uniref:Uncharacterized protein n=1 Tax=Tanacetum cinerariifolium TaxID=118510 RepID=A0A699VQ11_TANCI|nr:hypothetical protein [Tanacetum cinerariifolium]
MIVAGGPAVGMEPLPVGTSIPPARTVAASTEVKTLAISSESLLILSAAASPSLILLPLIGASSLDCWVTEGIGAVGIDGSGIDEVVGCDVSASGKGV